MGVSFTLPASCAWQYAAATGGITDTSDVTIAAAPGADRRNYLCAIQFLNTDATVGTELVVKSGSTVLWRGYAQHSVAAVSQPGMVSVVFPVAIRQPDLNTALTVAAITTSGQTYVNAQGWTGA